MRNLLTVILELERKCLYLRCLLAHIVFTSGFLWSPAVHAEERSPEVQQQQLQSSYTQHIRPLLDRYCIVCHGPDKQKGALRLDTLTTDFLVKANRDHEAWNEVLEILQHGEMPPPKAKQPSAQEHGRLTQWLRQAFDLMQAQRHLDDTKGRVVIRRLTAQQHMHTLNDLLGIDMDFPSNAMAETISDDGFTNNGSVMAISPLHLEQFSQSARRGLRNALFFFEQPKVWTKRLVANDRSRYRQLLNHLENMERKPVRDKEGSLKKLGPPPAHIANSDVKRKSGEPYWWNTKKIVFPSPYNRRKGGHMRLQINIRLSGADLGTQVPIYISSGTKARQKLNGRKKLKTVLVPAKAKEFEIDVIIDIAKVSIPAFDRPDPKQFDAHGRLKPIHKARFWLELLPHAPSGSAADFEMTVSDITMTYPYFATWPPASHSDIFTEKLPGYNEEQYIRSILLNFCSRAFRRPVNDSDIAPFIQLYTELRKNMNFQSASTEVLHACLLSADFLYLVEGNGAGGQITDHELANRLSYFLVKSMPDAELRKLADTGQLRDPQVLEAQVTRLLADPRNQRFLRAFTDQWLDLAKTDGIAIDASYFPFAAEHEGKLKQAFKQETRLLVKEVFDKDLSCLRLIDADFTFVNPLLAQHYGMAKPATPGFAKVRLQAEDNRGGLLTHGSIMLAHSSGAHSNLISRAVWLRKSLLDDPPPSPPAAVPNIDENDPKLQHLSFKQKIEAHRNNPACIDCHKRIDPWGIPLESYDALGRWRQDYGQALHPLNANDRKRQSKKPRVQSYKNAPAVESNSMLPNGTAIADITALKRYLVTDGRRRFTTALVRKVLSYSLGRTLNHKDRNAINTIHSAFEQGGYRLKDLLRLVACSDIFKQP